MVKSQLSATIPPLLDHTFMLNDFFVDLGSGVVAQLVAEVLPSQFQGALNPRVQPLSFNEVFGDLVLLVEVLLTGSDF